MDDGGTVMVDGSGLALPKWYPEWESLEEQLRRPHVGFAALDMAEPHAGHTLAMLGSVVSEVLSVGQQDPGVARFARKR